VASSAFSQLHASLFKLMKSSRNWSTKQWRDAERLCERQAVLGMDSRQSLLHPKQLHSMPLTRLGIVLPTQAFPDPGPAGPSLPPPITLGDNRRLLEASPQAATWPEGQNRLLGVSVGSSCFFFSLFFQSPLILPILFHKENLSLSLLWSSKILTSPLKAYNHPSP